MELKISNKFSIDANKLVSGRICVIGQSGSGKSYAVAVICEELAKNGIGFCIIDTEGEYFSLKEKYPLLWVGLDENSDINIQEIDLNLLAKKSIEKNIPVILDISEVANPIEIVKKFVSAAYKIESSLKQPYLIIIEEADKFVPQKGEYIKEIEEVSKRGRKRGLGLIIATQRPASVNKNILSQCNIQLIGRLTIKNDIDAVKHFFQNKEDLEKLPELKPGEFFVKGEIASPEIVKIRKRETKHKATTPKVVQKKIDNKELTKVKKELTEKIEIPEEVTVLCVEPKLDKNEAVAKIKKWIRLFKRKSLISNVNLILKPIYECEIKYLRKRLMLRDFVTIKSYFDGISGAVLSLAKGYHKICNLHEFIGLNQNDIEVFKELMKKKLSTLELAHKLKRSPEAIRLSLKNLISKNLVRSKRIGRSQVYFVFTKARLPSMKKLSQKEVEIKRMKLRGIKLEAKVKPKDISPIVRGIYEKADIVKEKLIYYPIYKALILKGKTQKTIYIDAVTGKRIKKF
ncbi:MAG: DUF87 domain-containing protein [Nanoarchaeota archaeon]|nr:DUF87 domain-containing protein [Nanoarchaeota archaeon]